ncbi:MAG: hypothetical protein H6566_18475 [Lewinellaceae bacterium]|nr:hypothetical protein [Lewinellaceae bacterium]
MRDYISTILPRIQQYSKQLNDEANFVEIPWAFLDEAGAKVTYIFPCFSDMANSLYYFFCLDYHFIFQLGVGWIYQSKPCQPFSPQG